MQPNITTNAKIHILDKIEYNLIPLCIIFGLMGNLCGSMCILTNKKMRRRTPLFILSCIGLSDSVLLLTQFQRWLSQHFNTLSFLIVSHISCKFYFTLFHLAMLLSCSLTFVLIFLRFVSLFMGKYRLSAYSNMGQMLTKLSFAYIFTLSLSICWHNLWKSGLTTKNQKPIIITDEYTTQVIKEYFVSLSLAENFTTQELRCTKNVYPPKLYIMLDLFSFLLIFILNLALALLPFIIMNKMRLKMRKLDRNHHQPSQNLGDSRFLVSNFGEKKSSSNQSSPSPPSFRASYSKTRPDIARSKSVAFSNTKDRNRYKGGQNLNCKSLSLEKLNNNNSLKKEITEENKKNSHKKERRSYPMTNNVRISTITNNRIKFFTRLASDNSIQPKHFTYSIMFMSILTGFLSFPFILMDYFYYKDALFVENLENKAMTKIDEFLIKIPYLMLNLAYAIKFYILFALYSKFRAQIGRFLRIRLYINKKIADSLKKQNRLSYFLLLGQRSASTNTSDALYDNDGGNHHPSWSVPSSSSLSDIKSIKFIMKHHFCFRNKPLKCNKNDIESASEIPTKRAFSSESKTRDEVRIDKILTKMKNDDYDDETSSIVGYKAYPNTSTWTLYTDQAGFPLMNRKTSITAPKFSLESNSTIMPNGGVSCFNSRCNRSMTIMRQEKKNTVVLTPRNPIIESDEIT